MTKIKIRHGDNEIEIEGDNLFISNNLQRFYQQIEQKFIPSQTLKQTIFQDASPGKPSKLPPTPAEFYKEKSKNNRDGISQIIIFGKYLEEYEKKPQFTQNDINRVAADAKVSKDIHSQYFTNAVKKGLLRSHGKGTYSITLSGEEVFSTY